MTTNGYPYIYSPYFEGSILELKTNIDDNVAVLLLYLKEITTQRNDKRKVEYFKSIFAKNKVMMCSFWNTEYSVSFGASRSTAEDRLAEGIASYDGYEGCSAIGSVDQITIYV